MKFLFIDREPSLYHSFFLFQPFPSLSITLSTSLFIYLIPSYYTHISLHSSLSLSFCLCIYNSVYRSYSHTLLIFPLTYSLSLCSSLFFCLLSLSLPLCLSFEFLHTILMSIFAISFFFSVPLYLCLHLFVYLSDSLSTLYLFLALPLFY